MCVFGTGLIVNMARLRQLREYLHKVLSVLRDAWDNVDFALHESTKQQICEMLFFSVELERALKEERAE
jgi:hypothetical protein